MAVQFTCTKCWTRGDRESLHASCPDCSRNAGQEITRLLGDFMREGRQASADVPRCSPHKAVLVLRCPNCNAIVDRRLIGNVDRRVIAMSGVPAAGKTSMLWATRRYVGVSELQLSAIGDADEQIETLIRQIRKGNGQQGHTPATDATERNFAWEVMKLNSSGDTVGHPMLLAIHDVAGETWNWLARGGEVSPALRRYLELIGGVMLVLDGEALLDVLTRPNHPIETAGDDAVRRELALLETLVRHLPNAANVVSLAIVISKADLLWDLGGEWTDLKEGSPATENVLLETLGRLLTAAGRRELRSRPKHEFRRVKLFAVSALGFNPENGFDPARVKPSRIAEPLQWLLNEVG